MADRDTVTDWMHAYIRAWDSNDPADIRTLFTPDAEYRFRPYDEPVVGHDAITAEWLDGADEPDDHTFDWEIVAAEGDTGVVQGRTEYLEGDSAGELYENLWIIRFAADGRARSFTEWYMEAPDEDDED